MAYQTSNSNYGLFPAPVQEETEQPAIQTPISVEEEQGIISDFIDMMQQGAYGAAADMLTGVRGLLTDDKIWTMEQSLREGVARQQETLSQAQKDANENFGMFGDDTEFSGRGLMGAVASGLGSTVPFMVAGGGAGAIGRAAAIKLASQKAAQGGISASAAGEIGSAVGAGSVGAPAIGGSAMNETDEILSSLSQEQLKAIPSFENYLQAANGDIQLAKEVYIEDAKNSALKQGAVLGAMSMGVAAPFLEKLIKGGYGFVQGVKTGAVTELGQEAFESGGQRRIINPLTGQPEWENVAVDAAEGGVIGSIAGGVGGGAFSMRSPKDVPPDDSLDVDAGNKMLGLPDMGLSTGEFIIHPDGSESRASEIFNTAMQESGGDAEYAQRVVDNIRANASRNASVSGDLQAQQYREINADVNQANQAPFSTDMLAGGNIAQTINQPESIPFKRRPSQRPENQDAYNTVQLINQPEPSEFKESPSKKGKRDSAYGQYQDQQADQKESDSNKAYDEVTQPGVKPGQMFTPTLTRKERKAFNKALAKKEQEDIYEKQAIVNANDFRDNLGFAIQEYKDQNQTSGELENVTLQHLIEIAYGRTIAENRRESENPEFSDGTTEPGTRTSRTGDMFDQEGTERDGQYSGNEDRQNQNTTTEGGLEPKTEESTTGNIDDDMSDNEALAILSGETNLTTVNEYEQKDQTKEKDSGAEAETRRTKVNMDKVAAKNQLIKDIDAAIKKAKDITGKQVKDSLPVYDSSLPNDVKDAIKRQIKLTLDDIGYTTFNVKDAGTYKVLNTKEHLANFKKKIEKSSGFKVTPKSRAGGIQNRPSKASTLRIIEDFIKDEELENAYNAIQLGDVPIGFGVNNYKGTKKPVVYTSISPVDLIPDRNIFVGRRWEEGKWKWAVIDNDTGNSFEQSEATKLKAVGTARATIKRLGPDEVKTMLEKADKSDSSANQEELSKLFSGQFEQESTTPEPTPPKPGREKNEKTETKSVSPDKGTDTKTDGVVDADSKDEQKVSGVPETKSLTNPDYSDIANKTLSLLNGANIGDLISFNKRAGNAIQDVEYRIKEIDQSDGDLVLMTGGDIVYVPQSYLQRTPGLQISVIEKAKSDTKEEPVESDPRDDRGVKFTAKEVTDHIFNTTGYRVKLQKKPGGGTYYRFSSETHPFVEKGSFLSEYSKLTDNSFNDFIRGFDSILEAENKATQFKDNKIFTNDAVEAARARLKKKLGTTNSGFDPEMAMDGLIISGAYIEAGIRDFGQFSKAILADIGAGAKPYLRSWYEAARHYPGLDTKGMSNPDAIELMEKYNVYKGDRFEYKGEEVEVLWVSDNSIMLSDKTQIHGIPSVALFIKNATKIKPIKGEENGNEREDSIDQNVDGKNTTSGTFDEESNTIVSTGAGNSSGGTDEGQGGHDTDISSSGQGDGLRTDNITMEGQQTDGSGKQDDGRGTSQNGHVPEYSGGNDDAPVNYDLRDKPNIVLTPAKRRDINNKVKEILKKPVNEITEADKEILRQYTGAGGLNLKDSVDEGAGIFNQHYTGYDTIRAIFDALDNASIKQTKALEPSVGSGNFIGFAPALNWQAVDIDKVNTDVVERLYPEAVVSNESYETFKGKNFDLIVSNVPFASFSALPRAHANTVQPQFKAIHNFFFAQSLYKLKTGGVMAFMTSTGTMDGTQEAKRLRTRLMNNADIIGAYRLPEGTQSANANTDVSIDIIFIQKRPVSATPTDEQQAKNESFINIGSKDGYKINQYFLDNPDNILGNLEVGKIKTSMGKLGLIVTGSPDYNNIVIEPQTYDAEKKATKSNFSTSDDAEQFAKDNGYKFSNKTEPFYDSKTKTTYDRVVTYTDEEGSGLLGRKVIGVNSNKMQLLQAIEDSKDVALIEKYKAEYEKPPHKDLSLRSFAKNNNALSQLKQFQALFNEAFEPSEIFSKKVRFKDSGKIEVTKDSPLLERAESVEDQDGILDDREKILSTNDIQKLLDSGAYARISNTKLQNSKLYYAGNIYKKLDALKSVTPAAQRDKQRTKLESVKPELIPIERITITGKETWLPDSAVTSIGKEVLSKDETLYGTAALENNKELQIYNRYLKGETLVKKHKDDTEMEYVDNLKKAQTYIDEVILPKIKNKLINDGLEEELVEAYNRDRNFYTDPDFTNITLKHIPETFRGQDFILMQHQEEGIERGMYNKKGAIAFAPGLGKTPTAVILADQQMRRGIFKKPLFIVPANTIPQWIETTQQLYPDAKIYNYPLDSKGNPKDWAKMTKDDKEKMLYDLTNNQYDYTFVSTNLAQKFRPPMRDMKRYVKNLANQIIGMEEDDEGLSKSQLKRKEKRLADVALMTNTMLKAYEKSEFDMGKMGFDAIIADEVQQYKNIGMQAGETRGGLGANVSVTLKYPKLPNGKENKDADPISATIGSSRSYDFRFKTQYISENNNGNNVYLLTGTPTPNKPLELMTLLYHLDSKILDEYGITNISQFVDEFFEVSEVESTDVSGKAKMSPELSGIKNVDSLKKIIGRYIDYRSPESAKGLVRPKEKRVIHTILKNANADKIFADIQKRLLKAIEDAKRLMAGEVGKDEYIERVIQMYNAGRDASIDVRLYNPTSKSEITVEGTIFEEETRANYSKIAKTVELVAAKNAENPDAGQLIFLDRLNFKALGTSTHSDIRDKVIAATGLDPKQVVYVNGQGHINPKTGTPVNSGPKPERLQEIINAYNRGEIKVLIGNTPKLGVGVDLQVKTTDVYQIDKPYRPDEVEQRTNRAVRQGNENSEVTVHFFYTPGTFDDMSDRLLADKQGFNDVFWKDQNEANIDVSNEGAPDAYSAAIELETDPVLKRKLEIERDIFNSGRKTKDLERNISNLVKHGRSIQGNIDQYRNSIEGIDTRAVPAYAEMDDKDRAKAVRDYKARMKIQRAKHVVNLDRLSGEFSDTSEDLDKRKAQLAEHREYISNLLAQFSVDGVIDVDKVSVSMNLKKSLTSTQPVSKLTPDEVIASLPAKNRKMVSKGNIKVVANIKALKDALSNNPDALSDIGNGEGLQGVYVNNTVYLVANRLTQDTIIPTLNHELFHSYLDRNPSVKAELLNRAGNVYDAFSDMFDRDYNRKYREIMAKAMDAVNSAGTSPEDRIEELAAYMVTEWSKNPQGLLPKIRKAVMNLVAYIKSLAFRAGIDVGKLTPADLTALARSTNFNKPGTGGRAKFSNTSNRSKEELIESFKRKAGQGPKKTLSDSIRNILDQGIDGNKAKIKDWWKETKPLLEQGIFDKHLGIKLAEQNVLGEIIHATSGYIGARLSTGSSATMRALLKYGAPIWKKGVIARKEGTKGFVELLVPVKNDIEGFTSWFVARRAKRLYNETWTDDKGVAHRKENNFDIDEINAILETEKPEYQGVADGVAEMNNAVLDLAVEAGIINNDSRKLFSNNDYIPFYRVVDSEVQGGTGNKKGLSHQTSGIKMLKGGENPMSDPLGNLMQNWNHLIDASMKNSALDKTLTNLEGSDYVTKIPSVKFEKALIPKEQIRALMLESGLPKFVVDLMPDDVIKGVGEMWAMKAPQDPDVVRVMRKGKAQYYKVNDGMLLTSLVGLDRARLGGIFKPMRYMKSLLTRSVTATPTFMMSNFIRDSLHSFTVAEEKGFKLGIDSFKGAVSTFKEDALSIEMMFSGASFQGGYGSYNDPENAKASMDAVMRVAGVSDPKGSTGVVIDSVEKYMDMYRAIGDAVENSNRDAIAKNSKNAGDSEAKYLFESKDIMDFSMGGSFMIVRALSDMLPFFNARLQGIYRLARSGQTEEAKKLILAKGLSISIASLALLAVNADNEDYEALEDWDKDIYWHIFVGDLHFKIPKPFELGLIFGTIPERSARALVGKDSLGKFSERMLAGAGDTLAMNPIPQMFKPFAEVYSNTNMFTDRPIEGMGDRNKLPSARYNDYTSETMRQISSMLPESLGASPKRLEHLMRGYLGSLGMYALGASDMVVRGMADMPSRPAMRMDRMPVLKALYKEEPAMYTKYGTDFYNMMNEVNQLSATINAYKKEGRGDKAAELMRDNAQKLSTKRVLSNTNKQVRKLRKQIGVISRSNLSASDKRKRVNMLLDNYNEVVKQTVLSVDKFFN